VESKRGDEETTSMVLPFKFLTKIYDYIRETSITTSASRGKERILAGSVRKMTGRGKDTAVGAAVAVSATIAPTRKSCFGSQS
jgi:hypothetical protein